jgi:hypothetical protein
MTTSTLHLSQLADRRRPLRRYVASGRARPTLSGRAAT